MTWIIVAAFLGFLAGWARERSVRAVREDRFREELWEVYRNVDALRQGLNIAQDPLARLAVGCQTRVAGLIHYLEGGPIRPEVEEEDHV